MAKYCVYCGDEKKHSEECVFIKGVPEGVAGIRPIEGDLEYNLNLGRMAILMTIRPSGIGAKTKKIDRRLAYEVVAFQIRRRTMNKIGKKSMGIFARKKDKKALQSIINFAKSHEVPEKDFKRLMETEDVKLSLDGGEHPIPLMRDSKTNKLTYKYPPFD